MKKNNSVNYLKEKLQFCDKIEGLIRAGGGNALRRLVIDVERENVVRRRVYDVLKAHELYVAGRNRAVKTLSRVDGIKQIFKSTRAPTHRTVSLVIRYALKGNS